MLSLTNLIGFGGGASGYIFNHTISSSSTTPFNLKASAITAGWNQIDPLSATVTINNGVNQQSNAIGTPAFDTGVTFPLGTILRLINNGTVTGYAGADGASGAGHAGGGGGQGSSPSVLAGGTGGTGGTGGIALKAQFAISVTNGSGSLIGGSGGSAGGGGGGGGAGLDQGTSGTCYGGAGGNGWPSYTGGGAGQSPLNVPGGAGGASSGAAGSVGGSIDGGTSYYIYGGSGGAGGSGGTQGQYCNGNSNVTWVSNGTKSGGVA
jgi:hypothetical protein